MLIASHKTLTEAATHLKAVDPLLTPVIETHGLCTITPHTNYYQELVESIISQQLSVRAARSILQKFLHLFDGTFPEPEQILEKSIEELRSAGLSNAKARYIQDLAEHVQNKTIQLDILNTLSNVEIVRELTAVKGIGEWTAHMFLMFCMGRLDILPYGDLGIKNGIQKMYGLDHLPSPQDIQSVALENNWAPYESVASWYIWRSLETT
jgi:DNA-3-methyladenine glycosylase II